MRKNKEIQEELNELSPELAKISFTEVYEVPEGYFDQFPVSVFKNLNDQQIQDVPEGYFESLSDNILSKINDQAKIIPISKSRFYIRVAIAAVIVGLLGYGVINFITTRKAATPPSLVMQDSSKATYASNDNVGIEEKIKDLNEEEIISYLEENGHDVNAAIVASLDNDNAEFSDKSAAEAENLIFEELTDKK